MRTFLLLTAAGVLLAGCGFQPLYADRLGVAAGLSSVDVVTPSSRTGQILREELDDELARREGGAPVYRLAVDIDEDRFQRGLRIDDTANRYELRLTVGWRLTDLRSGIVLGVGSEPVYVTYDSADQPYAGVAAHQDGQARAASEAARILRTKVALTLAGPGGTAAGR